MASRAGRSGSVTIHQDVDLYAATISPGGRIATSLGAGRYGWVQVAKGTLKLNNVSLQAGDGAGLSDETAIDIRSAEGGEFLFFDLA